MGKEISDTILGSYKTSANKSSINPFLFMITEKKLLFDTKGHYYRGK